MRKSKANRKAAISKALTPLIGVFPHKMVTLLLAECFMWANPQMIMSYMVTRPVKPVNRRMYSANKIRCEVCGTSFNTSDWATTKANRMVQQMTGLSGFSGGIKNEPRTKAINTKQGANKL